MPRKKNRRHQPPKSASFQTFPKRQTMTPQQQQRLRRVLRRVAAGDRISDIARNEGITPARVQALIRPRADRKAMRTAYAVDAIIGKYTGTEGRQ